MTDREIYLIVSYTIVLQWFENFSKSNWQNVLTDICILCTSIWRKRLRFTEIENCILFLSWWCRFHSKVAHKAIIAIEDPKEKTQGVNLIKIKKCLFHSQAVQKQLDVVISLFLFQRLATVWAVLRQAGDVTHHTSTSQMMANLDISFHWSCSPWWKNAAGIALTPIKQSLTLEQTAKTSHQRKTPAANF